MSEMSPGSAAAGAAAMPSGAAGGMPDESNLPGLQGLDNDVPADDEEAVPVPNPDGASLAERTADSSQSASDPMPDAAGTGS